jgi:glutathione S-transferase
MIKLHQFPTDFGLPNFSPFCMKLEVFLKMADIDYEIVEVNNPAKGPKHKAPFIEDGDLSMGDSELIIAYLQKKHGIDLDQGLSAAQRALSRSVQKMLDEHLYWAMVYSRWIDDRGFAIVGPLFFGDMPPIIRNLVPKIARRGVSKALWQVGMGRHSNDEIYAFGVDACAFAYVASMVIPPIENPLKEAVKSQPRLLAYHERMMQRYFSGQET